ncbi:fimbrial biogenesis chaperone [Mangrovibacter plantisponsor]|uniref:P pilus assembly chaperone PapD n=1 Tax=Mangrovibacter plantisponsor TaxID=451513 RepID=A0A317PWJ2_9ENTR|nr:fimbria/pilus periplasmic chaperone [Mangrovibacter plantisponsor]PWW07084.1 P pilus assembly chaperone PapD [Mangrovibacter plantisponsor]
MPNSRWWSAFSKLTLLATLFIAGITPAMAVVSPDRSRVILNENVGEESLLLTNNDGKPSLVQMWTDDGDPLLPIDKLQVPVVILPPVFSIEGGQQHDVRIKLLHPHTMQADQAERLYWINIYQVPPNTQLARPPARQVVMPLRIRMKLIIRPDSLGELRQEEGEKIDFTIKDSKHIELQNSGKRVMSVSVVKINHEIHHNIVLLPGEHQDISLNSPIKLNQKHQVDWSVISDNGVNWNYQKIF